MKLGAKIHPDKLPGCPDATKAFQALVRAYEKCLKPELREDESEESGDEPCSDQAQPAEPSKIRETPKAAPKKKKRSTGAKPTKPQKAGAAGKPQKPGRQRSQPKKKKPRSRKPGELRSYLAKSQ